VSDQYVGAVDQGTTGTRFVVFDRAGRVVGDAYETHEQHYPEPGWVEHDPDELWANTKRVLRDGLEDAGVGADQLAALGVANQRETTLLWDAETGEPLHRAIVWQDRRTTDRVEALEAAGRGEEIRARTGLEPDAYFSATKAEWLFDHAEEPAATRERAGAGEVLFGTVDTWLVWQLTGVHVTDTTNASRTMLFDIHDRTWDERLCAEFGVPRGCLPAVEPSSPAEPYGHTDPGGVLGAAVPVAGALGDQQAALFGQTCFEPGEVKSTYGTGSFVLMNTGTEAVTSEHGLLTTVGFERAGQPVQYALEGSVFVTGAALEWLADVGVVEDAAETEALVAGVDSTDGVYFVPAFTGLGAPYWDGRARGTIVGLTRGTGREHLARAALEAIAFRTRDVVTAMEADADIDRAALRVDGGAVANDALCGLVADALDTTVDRPAVRETTALGAAYAAGLAVGYWDSVDDLRANRRVDAEFTPSGGDDEWDRRYGRWKTAVERARDWADP
jgi:glycerol kinase